MVIQWLRLYAPKAWGLGSIPGQGSRSSILHLEIWSATSKTHQSQINKYSLKLKKKREREIEKRQERACFSLCCLGYVRTHL